MTPKLPRNATVIALACALIAGACGGGATPASGSPSPSALAVTTASATPIPTAPPTPTPTPKPKLWPLTGLPAAADAQL
ncbi:MAG TPA: ABC transporter substrate-binding protein, partial [Candidatus Limnocylindria bacterium]